MEIIHKWQQRFQDVLWNSSTEALPKSKASLIRAGRILYRVIYDVAQGQLTLRAMSLVYTTLLSIVPLLALSFSVLKAFGVHNQLEPMLMNFLAPLGEEGEKLVAQIVHFVENMSVGVLGSLGLLLLVYTVISLIQKIESSFNFIWRVVNLRSLAQRISGYLSVVMVGPMLVVTALGITATVASTAMVRELITIEPLGTLYYGLSKVIPYLLVIGAFTATYMIIPNTTVKFRSAMIGGLFAGVLWESVGWGFASFIVGSAKYEAVYSGFAIVILLLVWLYLNWLVLLLGASIAFYHQNPAYQTMRGERTRLSTRGREALALEILRLVGEAYQRGTPHWTPEGLAEQLRLPMESINLVVERLLAAGLLICTGDNIPYYVPGRDLGTISIKETLNAIAGELAEDNQEIAFADERVKALLHELDSISQTHLKGKNIRSLLPSSDIEPPA